MAPTASSSESKASETKSEPKKYEAKVKGRESEPRPILGVDDPEAAYISPDMTYRDGGGEELPDYEQKHVEDLERATKEEREEAVAHEQEVVKRRREEAEKKAEEEKKNREKVEATKPSAA